MKVKMRTFTCFGALALCAISLASHAVAATKTWDGGAAGTGSVLTTAANWVGDTAPVAGDDLILDPAFVSTGTIGNSSGYMYLTTSSGSSVTAHSLTLMNNNLVTFAANSSDVATARTLTLTGAGAAINVLGTDVTFGRSFGGPLGVVLSAATTVNVSNANTLLTFSNTVVISGTGSMTKTGEGTVLMGRYNTFSGGFTLEAGTVRTNFPGVFAMTEGPLGTGTVTLKGGNLQSVSESSRVYYNNVVLDGDIAFGATTGNGAATQTFSSGSGGTSTILASDSTLNTLADVIWNQNISTSGTDAYRITKTGGATLSLAGTNTNISGFSVLGGVLEFGGVSTMGGTVSEYVSNYFEMDGGTIRFTSTVNTTPLTGNRGFMLGAGGGTIDVASGVIMNANGRFRESAPGASLVKSGLGTYIMGAGVSEYTGATLVSQGTLLLDGDASIESSPVTVSAGATFGGLGTVGGAVTVSGTLSPGTLVTTEGALEINNALSLDSSAVVLFGLSTVGADQITGVTDLTLDGVIKVSLVGGYVPLAGQTFQLIDWSGTLVDNGFVFDFTDASLPEGMEWDTANFLTDGTITAVPEPAVVSLALASLGLLALRRTRRGSAVLG